MREAFAQRSRRVPIPKGIAYKLDSNSAIAQSANAQSDSSFAQQIHNRRLA
jgi:hypothetical protein